MTLSMNLGINGSEAAAGAVGSTAIDGRGSNGVTRVPAPPKNCLPARLPAETCRSRLSLARDILPVPAPLVGLASESRFAALSSTSEKSLLERGLPDAGWRGANSFSQPDGTILMARRTSPLVGHESGQSHQAERVKP